MVPGELVDTLGSDAAPPLEIHYSEMGPHSLSFPQ